MPVCRRSERRGRGLRFGGTRVCPTVGAGFHPRPGVGLEELAELLLVGFTLCCLFHPISLVLPKETGWSPKEKRLWGGGAPVRFRDPPASPTRVGGATRPLRCPLRGLIFITRPRGEGVGLDVDWRLKVFCPAFLQKSGRGPGAAPRPRAAARGTLLCSQGAGGGKGGTLAGGSPFAGGPAARSPRDLRTPAVIRRRAGVGGTWWAGDDRDGGTSRTPSPTGLCGTGRVPRDLPSAGCGGGNS